MPARSGGALAMMVVDAPVMLAPTQAPMTNRNTSCDATEWLKLYMNRPIAAA
ncbi:hypothetical protein D3C76_1541880 [compost metagenome]